MHKYLASAQKELEHRCSTSSLDYSKTPKITSPPLGIGFSKEKL
jgi:hypothetical protein